MRHTILHADVMDGLRSLPDRSVHCIITSPPYWGLRDYGVEGQIGLEPTPEEYVQKIVAVFREARRVLRDDGTMWLNYGDSYARSRSAWGLKAKDLVGIPWRVAFALQADGWYLRSDIIWAKPNPMPESVRDRPTKSHEYVFLLTKRPRYFYDADAVRERIGEPVRMAASFRCGGIYTNNRSFNNHGVKQNATHGEGALSYSGRNRRDVWTIPTRPYKGAHFATFPPALVEPCLLAGTSERGACPECGAPWRRVVERVRDHGLAPVAGGKTDNLAETHRWSRLHRRTKAARAAGVGPNNPFRHGATLGWQPSCACGTEETVPCVVLDPFAGSGTVGAVAAEHGRSAVLIELNPEYVSLIKKRLAEVQACGGPGGASDMTEDMAQIERAMGGECSVMVENR